MTKTDIIRKYITPFSLVFALEIAVVFLTAMGLLPRESVLFVTGILVFFVLFSEPLDALKMVVASIPLYVALPVSESFDHMANWRIIVLVLFLNIFWKRKEEFIQDFKNFIAKRTIWFYLLGSFAGLSILSVFIASSKTMALKELAFLINIFLLFIVALKLISDKKSLIEIWKSAALGGSMVIFVSIIQFISVLFVPLSVFWNFWVNKAIPVFYGGELASLLSYSNTWFAYYAQNPPTLRLFSVFPDSHSLAMFSVLLVPIYLVLVFLSKRKSAKIIYWAAAVFCLFSIVFSGSRGAWVSVLPVMILAVLLFWRGFNREFLKKSFAAFFIFIFAFIAYSGYPFFLYKFQSWQGIGEGGGNFKIALFERAKSISDFWEISNKGRLEIWRLTFESIGRRPILGVGLGNYVDVLREDASVAKKGASAHSLYLDFASEIGIFGALILLAIFGFILYDAWLVFEHSKENYLRLFGLFFALYFIWILVYSLFDVVLLNDKAFLLFMAVLGTLYGAKELTKTNR